MLRPVLTALVYFAACLHVRTDEVCASHAYMCVRICTRAFGVMWGGGRGINLVVLFLLNDGRKKPAVADGPKGGATVATDFGQGSGEQERAVHRNAHGGRRDGDLIANLPALALPILRQAWTLDLSLRGARANLYGCLPAHPRASVASAEPYNPE